MPAHTLLEISPALLFSAEEYEAHGRHTVLDHYTFEWRDGRMALALGLGALAHFPPDRVSDYLVQPAQDPSSITPTLPTSLIPSISQQSPSDTRPCAPWNPTRNCASTTGQISGSNPSAPHKTNVPTPILALSSRTGGVGSLPSLDKSPKHQTTFPTSRQTQTKLFPTRTSRSRGSNSPPTRTTKKH